MLNYPMLTHRNMKTPTFDILKVVKIISIGIAILISYQSESRYHMDTHRT